VVDCPNGLPRARVRGAVGLGIGEGLCEAWAALIMPGHSLEVVRGVALVGVVHCATATTRARSTSSPLARPHAEAGGRPRRQLVRGMHLDVGAQSQSSPRSRVKTARVARVAGPNARRCPMRLCGPRCGSSEKEERTA
jgi:hypothetical protein